MRDEDEDWELWQGETLIGRLLLEEQDMFWFTCRFEPTDAFERHRDLFAQGEQLVGDHDAFNQWYRQVRDLGMRLLRPADGKAAYEFILYINGDKASFRPRF